MFWKSMLKFSFLFCVLFGVKNCSSNTQQVEGLTYTNFELEKAYRCSATQYSTSPCCRGLCSILEITWPLYNLGRFRSQQIASCGHCFSMTCVFFKQFPWQGMTAAVTDKAVVSTFKWTVWSIHKLFICLFQL